MVVADHADVVAIAEPPVEERLLQRVHVLVLVDGERLEARSHEGDGLGDLVEQAHREPEHVLEVDPPGPFLAALVPVEDRAHQLDGDRRGVLLGVEDLQVAGR